ncbi:MAG: glycosyltransferase family 4 protein [Rhodospirillaceae bacterium]|nr:glycosyltransferase family 4 protein [Rhodospirillaceae bacterium]
MGGIESHCEQLFPRLGHLGAPYDITVLGRHPYIAAGTHEYRGIKVVSLPAARNKYFEAISNTVMAVLYARFVVNADLVHIHGIGPALLGPLARLFGMKLVVTHHGQDFNRAKWNRLARLVLRLGEQCAIHAAHQVIVVSRSVASNLRRRNPHHEARIQYIPNGATELVPDATSMDEGARLQLLGLKAGDYILAVGRLVPEKGFHFLIAAFNAARPGRKLVIAGKADHEDAYSRSLMALASDQVIFCGFQKQGMLRTLYQNAALFVLPSTHEGLPIAALEAANLGIPVLLSDIQANLDIGLAPGNYFKSADPAALAEKLTQNYAAYRVDGADIGRRFNWDAITKATQRVYAGLAAG